MQRLAFFDNIQKSFSPNYFSTKKMKNKTAFKKSFHQICMCGKKL